MSQCTTTKRSSSYRCPREASPGLKQCEECRAGKRAVALKRREQAKAEKAAFMARHATRTPPPIAKSDETKVSTIELGKRYGATTPLARIDGANVRALCHHCDRNYDCPRYRINLGIAAKHGCGCLKLAMRGAIPPPMPLPIGPYSRKETSL